MRHFNICKGGKVFVFKGLFKELPNEVIRCVGRCICCHHHCHNQPDTVLLPPTATDGGTQWRGEQGAHHCHTQLCVPTFSFSLSAPQNSLAAVMAHEAGHAIGSECRHS